MSAVKKETKKAAAKPEFKFGETAKSDEPNTITGVLPIQAYLVEYNDGASKKEVRLVFKVPGAKTAFILQERIQGQHVATAATSWFNEAFGKKLAEKGLVDSENAGSEGAESV